MEPNKKTKILSATLIILNLIVGSGTLYQYLSQHVFYPGLYIYLLPFETVVKVFIPTLGGILAGIFLRKNPGAAARSWVFFLLVSLLWELNCLLFSATNLFTGYRYFWLDPTITFLLTALNLVLIVTARRTRL